MQILIIFLVILFFLLIWIYNKLVKLENQVKEGWSGVEVQLKRRHDLIPNFIEAVKGYMSYEKLTLERVVQLRTQSVEITSISKKPPLKGSFQI